MGAQVQTGAIVCKNLTFCHISGPEIVPDMERMYIKIFPPYSINHHSHLFFAKNRGDLISIWVGNATILNKHSSVKIHD